MNPAPASGVGRKPWISLRQHAQQQELAVINAAIKQQTARLQKQAPANLASSREACVRELLASCLHGRQTRRISSAQVLWPALRQLAGALKDLLRQSVSLVFTRRSKS